MEESWRCEECNILQNQLVRNVRAHRNGADGAPTWESPGTSPGPATTRVATTCATPTRATAAVTAATIAVIIAAAIAIAAGTTAAAQRDRHLVFDEVPHVSVCMRVLSMSVRNHVKLSQLGFMLQPVGIYHIHCISALRER